jgi:hypothetical protein
MDNNTKDNFTDVAEALSGNTPTAPASGNTSPSEGQVANSDGEIVTLGRDSGEHKSS